MPESEALIGLTNEGKAMLLGPFFNPRASLRFLNQENKASPRARAGLEDLEARGLASCKREGKAEIWSLTERGKTVDRRLLTPDVFGFMSSEGAFPLAVPIGGGETCPTP